MYRPTSGMLPHGPPLARKSDMMRFGLLLHSIGLDSEVEWFTPRLVPRCYAVGKCIFACFFVAIQSLVTYGNMFSVVCGVVHTALQPSWLF